MVRIEVFQRVGGDDGPPERSAVALALGFARPPVGAGEKVGLAPATCVTFFDAQPGGAEAKARKWLAEEVAKAEAQEAKAREAEAKRNATQRTRKTAP